MSFIPVFILILGFTILVDYFAGICIENAEGKKRRMFLICSIIANVGVLFVFKYFNFFNHNLESLAYFLDWNYPIKVLSFVLPIGLSFHTFQSMSYTIEVYRGRHKAERNLGIFALYVMFYPQLVAGPIERPQNLLHQFYEKHEFDLSRIGSGLRLMLWGIFKKIVIADRLAIFVNTIFGNVYDYNGPVLLVAVIFFAFQIYCDFSGYSDIAIGAAEVMGFKLMKNFDRPYISRSISEFWRRWHISLSTWFKDYVYIPLGGNRVAPWRVNYNLLVTFLLSGLWHGANWTYVIWGGLNGVYLVAGNLSGKLREKISKSIGFNKESWFAKYAQISFTFILTCFAWIFFRANNFSDAKYVITNIFTRWDTAFLYNVLRQNNVAEFVIAILSIIFLLSAEYWYDNKKNSGAAVLSKPIIRWALCIVAIFIIFFLGEFRSQQFIYFQF